MPGLRCRLSHHTTRTPRGFPHANYLTLATPCIDRLHGALGIFRFLAQSSSTVLLDAATCHYVSRPSSGLLLQFHPVSVVLARMLSIKPFILLSHCFRHCPACSSSSSSHSSSPSYFRRLTLDFCGLLTHEVAQVPHQPVDFCVLQTPHPADFPP